MSPTKRYLALGDSYTIGETVPPQENFPNQVIDLLQGAAMDIEPARIIAVTGWTTNELEAGIEESNKLEPLRNDYDLVTLLIGVNNQYRGRSLENYKNEFEELLRKAIKFAGNQPANVIVLSIPDWGVTPFATGRDRAKIAREINEYNGANREIAERYHIYYIDVTTWTREAASDPALLASDGLHPSGKEYERWAGAIASHFMNPKR